MSVYKRRSKNPSFGVSSTARAMHVSMFVCVCFCVETTRFYNSEKLSIDRTECEGQNHNNFKVKTFCFENISILPALLCFAILN